MEARDRLVQSSVLRHVPVRLELAVPRGRRDKRTPPAGSKRSIHLPVPPKGRATLENEQRTRDGRIRQVIAKNERTCSWILQRGQPVLWAFPNARPARRTYSARMFRSPILHLRAQLHLPCGLWIALMRSHALHTLRSLHLVVDCDAAYLKSYVMAKLCALPNLDTVSVTFSLRDYDPRSTIAESIAVIPTLTSLTIDSYSDGTHSLPRFHSKTLKHLTV